MKLAAPSQIIFDFSRLRKKSSGSSKLKAERETAEGLKLAFKDASPKAKNKAMTKT